MRAEVEAVPETVSAVVEAYGKVDAVVVGEDDGIGAGGTGNGHYGYCLVAVPADVVLHFAKGARLRVKQGELRRKFGWYISPEQIAQLESGHE